MQLITIYVYGWMDLPASLPKIKVKVRENS